VITRTVLILALAFCGGGAALAQEAGKATATVEAAFAPWDDIESRIIAAIDSARSRILVQSYLLTSRRIAGTLIAARRRGVDVQVLADAEQHAKVPASRLLKLAQADIGVWLENRYQNAHNKIIIIDAGTESTVITGSYNLTWTAQRKNAENMLIVRNNAELTERYVMNWRRHREDAVPLSR
jgi:phosphatidylserine/phosphatidylglycerophosphate/cardiolipin synthase-like enzyme